MGARTEAPIVNQWALVIFIDFACNRDRFCLLYLPRPFSFGRDVPAKRHLNSLFTINEWIKRSFFFLFFLGLVICMGSAGRCLAMKRGLILNPLRL